MINFSVLFDLFRRLIVFQSVQYSHRFPPFAQQSARNEFIEPTIKKTAKKAVFFVFSNKTQHRTKYKSDRMWTLSQRLCNYSSKIVPNCVFINIFLLYHHGFTINSYRIRGIFNRCTIIFLQVRLHLTQIVWNLSCNQNQIINTLRLSKFYRM